MQSGDSIAADRREAVTGSFVRKTNESDVVGGCAVMWIVVPPNKISPDETALFVLSTAYIYLFFQLLGKKFLG